MARIICFDLEGPLSPQDNAYEVMGLVRDGHRIFEVLSRYDDILTLEGRPGYEPGDTLSLIVPFLLHHGITEEDVRHVSAKAKIVDGVKYTIQRLGDSGWKPYIISTSYRQHALSVAERIGVPSGRVYCTNLPLDDYAGRTSGIDPALMEEVERDILQDLYPSLDDEKKIKERLDRFFREDLPATDAERIMREVKVVGGQRKVDAVYDITQKKGIGLGDVIAVGDSITDYKMLARVRDADGISVVFNGNRYCIPYGSVGLASTDMRLLLVLTDAYLRGGKKEAMRVAGEWEIHGRKFMDAPKDAPEDLMPKDVADYLMEKPENFFGGFFNVLPDADEKKQEAVLNTHKKARSLVRGDAAKLG